MTEDTMMTHVMKKAALAAALAFSMAFPAGAAFTVYTGEIQFVAPYDGELESVTIQDHYLNVIYRNGEYAGCEWHPLGSPVSVLERWHYPADLSPDAPDFAKNWAENARRAGGEVETMEDGRGIYVVYQLQDVPRTVAQALYVKEGMLYEVHYYSSRKSLAEVRHMLQIMTDTVRQREVPSPGGVVISESDRRQEGTEKK